MDISKDEFELYAYYDPTFTNNPKTFDPIAWWNNSREAFPSLHLYAFDTLAIPAMSAECERVFSSTKKLIPPKKPPGRGHCRGIRVLKEFGGTAG